MPLSILTSTYTSGPQVFDASFALGVLKPEHLSAYVVGEIDGEGAQVYRPFVWNKLAQTMTITTPLTSGDVVVRARTVPKEILLTSFQAGADVTKRNLDFNSTHIIHAIHEIIDGRIPGFEVNANLEEIFAQIVDLAADASQSAIDAAASAALADAPLWGIGATSGRYIPNATEEIRGTLGYMDAASTSKPDSLATDFVVTRVPTTGGNGGLTILSSRNNIWTRFRNTTWGAWRCVASTFQGRLGVDLTLSVGATGDFLTLKDAFDGTAWFRFFHRRIILVMQEGYEIREGYLFPSGDFGMYRIRNWAGVPNEDGTSPVTPTGVHDDFVGVSVAGEAPAVGSDWYERSGLLFAGVNTVMPHIQCVINCRGISQGSYVLRQGSGTIWPKCGFINSGYNAIQCHAATVFAHAAFLSGAGGHAVRAAYGAFVNVQQAIMDGCCTRAEMPVSGGAIDCSRSSTVHARLAQINESRQAGVNVRRNSIVCLEDAQINDSAWGGVVLSGSSHSSAYNLECRRSGVGGSGSGFGRGVTIRTMSSIDLGGAVITNSGAGDPPADIQFENGGLGNLRNVTLTGGLNNLANVYGVTAWNSTQGNGIAFNSAV